MHELSPLAPAGDWRPSPAQLLLDAAGYHLSEAAIDARESSRRLTALAGQGGLTAPQRRRLQQLAELANLAGDGAQQLLAELV